MVTLTADRIILESYIAALRQAARVVDFDLRALGTMRARDILASRYFGAPIAIADVRIALRAARKEVSSAAC